MDDEPTAEPFDVDDGSLSPEQRTNLALQLARLNDNLEQQFRLIDQQLASDRRAQRRRWRIPALAALLIFAGIYRVESNRIDQRNRDQRQLDQVLTELCRSTNAARSDLRKGIVDAFAAVVDVAPEGDTKDKAQEAADRVHDQLAREVPIIDCSNPARFDALDQFDSCAEAKAAGATPLRLGDPGYSPRLDADGDGIACE